MNDSETRDNLSVTAHTVVSKQTGARSRRQYSIAFKRKAVEETLAGNDSVSVVARRHDINANLLFRWRRAYVQGQFSDRLQPLIPVSLKTEPITSRSTNPRPGPSSTGHIQVNLNNGHQVVVSGQVDRDQLQVILGALTSC